MCCETRHYLGIIIVKIIATKSHCAKIFFLEKIIQVYGSPYDERNICDLNLDQSPVGNIYDLDLDQG